MSERWRFVLDHMPFVMAAAESTRGQIVGQRVMEAILIGMISAVGAGYVSTVRLEERFNALQADVSRLRSEVSARTDDRYRAQDAARDFAAASRWIEYVEKQTQDNSRALAELHRKAERIEERPK